MTGRRFTYANVAATLALIFSMTGGALAAKHYLISSTSQISPRVLRSLHGASGPPGPRGPVGNAGPLGPEGRPGRDGHDGKPATTPPLVWLPLILEGRWEKMEEEEEGAPEFTKDAEGFVHLKGAITGTKSSSMQFAILPQGFRPTTPGLLLRAAGTNERAEADLVDVFIEANGAMFAEPKPGNDEHFVSLEGLTFFAGRDD